MPEGNEEPQFQSVELWTEAEVDAFNPWDTFEDGTPWTDDEAADG